MNIAESIVKFSARPSCIQNWLQYCKTVRNGKSERNGSVVRFKDGSAVTFSGEKPVEFVGA